MIGAIVGDVAGSIYEWDNIKSKQFELFGAGCRCTDDSIMTLAIAEAVLESGGDCSVLAQNAIDCMRKWGALYPNSGYGGIFRYWLRTDKPLPYNSFGNGAAMRVSACGWAATSLDEAKALSRAVTGVTHNHPKGLMGAEAVAVAIYLARQGKTLLEIREHIQANYYPLDFTLEQIRPTYEFDGTCQGTVPQAIEAVCESVDFEDAIRNAISIGGDSDTLAAIAGSIAEAYYGVPRSIYERACSYLDPTMLDVLRRFEQKYSNKIIE